MSKLNFKTRGGGSPQGKPRVWFCAHAGDYKAFFAPICEEILAKQNCAIYYDEEPAAAFDEESFFADLSQMNLFVMPVTARLLAGGGRALDVEFRYAVERHIPVLPLMQEQGLEELFNQKCGDLQFLDKNNCDVTAISYDEKLKKYLSSILIGDEMAAKVRNAFDAYIFLSYRKKDRKYAQELMRLIHANEFCRDIAIWYDEFLTPGENFNDSIAEALAKSKLFALAVTPNLVNEKNYVMTVEYPEAVRAGKKILPAELVPTDRAELAVKYENIPECTDAHDSKALASMLANALENIALKENDSDPEHNFFIGLAYLGGIDVEVDHARAKALIEGAAEAGLPEAMEKLVAMYCSGEGVTRDYKKAIEWQEKLTARRRSIYESTQSEDDAHKYMDAIFDLGSNYLLEIIDFKKAKEIYGKLAEDAAEIISKFELEGGKRNYTIYIINSWDMLGSIAKAEDNLADARRYYTLSLKACEMLAEEFEGEAARARTYSGGDNLGDTASANLEKELVTWAKGFIYSGYDNLGDTALAEGDIAEAKRYYMLSLEAREALAKEEGAADAKRGITVSYNKLGDMAKAEGNLAEAKRYYTFGLKARERLAKEEGTAKAKRDLSESYDLLGDISKAEGNLAEAKQYYMLGLEIREALAKETDTEDAKHDLSISYNKLGDIAKAEGNIAEAKHYHMRYLEILEVLSEETGMTSTKFELSVYYNSLGDAEKTEGNLAEAKRYYTLCLKTVKAPAEETFMAEAKILLVLSYDSLGDIEKKEGNLTEAKRYYTLALEAHERLEEETGTAAARSYLSIIYEKLGDIARDEENFAEAKRYYTLSLEIREALAKEIGTADAYHDLAEVYLNLGWVNDGEEKRQYFQKALDIWTHLSADCPDVREFAALRDVAEEMLRRLTPKEPKFKSFLRRIFGKKK